MLVEVARGAPAVGIVTVLYNSARFLPEFWESYAFQTLSNTIMYAIDNKSVDNSAALLRDRAAMDPRVVAIINDNNVGVAAANNQGIQRALQDGCEWVLLLNNDTTFPPDMIEGLIAACRDNDWRIVVPKIYYDTPPKCLWYAGGGFDACKGYTGYHLGKMEADVGQYDRPCTVGYAPTCVMLIHRSVFPEVGLMDESYFVYYDDTDFCWRLKKKGIVIGYWPGTTLVHKVGGSTGGESPFTITMTARNRLYYLRKHFGLLAALLWGPVFLAYYVVRYLILSRKADLFKASIRGTLAFTKLAPQEPVLRPAGSGSHTEL